MCFALTQEWVCLKRWVFLQCWELVSAGRLTPVLTHSSQCSARCCDAPHGPKPDPKPDQNREQQDLWVLVRSQDSYNLLARIHINDRENAACARQEFLATGEPRAAARTSPDTPGNQALEPPISRMRKVLGSVIGQSLSQALGLLSNRRTACVVSRAKSIRSSLFVCVLMWGWNSPKHRDSAPPRSQRPAWNHRVAAIKLSWEETGIRSQSA